MSMMRFARMDAGVVAEIIEVPADGTPLAERFHATLQEAMVEAPPGVAPGWRRVGDTWAEPLAVEPDLAAMATAARTRRDAMLAACDWTQIGDAPLSSPGKAGWKAYRAALRAVPDQPGFPGSITWPEPPA